ncbi:glycosyltransferase family 4 protein [Lapillicoccus jejuensis]|uniref:Glycosyltransferase involved in cell wall biosynthesis n=1 Tax=Lapillicoccus jejuensis TaxID=402171 RepID=A0A542DVE2_9MICO|nr:glycosyltransferase family 4 protein [Lapillicoccus jejuensis]TQJ07069.1 glycosyltransferase involved in cell wall biosynthesis [Lapillicoccus jejuensis]
MRVALLSYRSAEHCGGQGVYVRHLSGALVDLGHDVEVLSGPPYPDFLDPRVRLTRVPSLDLYREPDPFRTPRPSELRTRYDVLEWLTMLTGCFAEPLAFSLRVGRLLRDRPAEQRPDVVHDNQTLGWGLPALRRAGIPLVATVHHPISRDLALELAAAPTRGRRVQLRRWYAFVPMQAAVTRRLPVLLGVSRAAADDTERDFRLRPGTVQVVPLGVDTDLFAPSAGPRTAGRLVAVASSADQPLKGVSHLLDAVAKLRAERDVTLDLVGRLEDGGPARRRIAELGLEDAVTVHTGITDEALAGLLASAQLAVVASLYEGFSLPTVEAMACGTPVVASDAGALPEVLGDAGVLVPPGDAEAIAAAVRDLLDDDAERARLGAAARARAEDRFSWVSVARRTVAAYEEERALHTSPSSRTAAPQGSSSC